MSYWILQTDWSPPQHTIRPVAIPTAEAFGTPIVRNVIRPQGIASAEAFGTVTFRHYIYVGPGAISDEDFGRPSIARVIRVAYGIGTLEAFGTPTIRRAMYMDIGELDSLVMDFIELGVGQELNTTISLGCLIQDFIELEPYDKTI